MYKGKFHLVKPGAISGEYTQQDLAAYGYAQWNPPDAGANQLLSEGGGNPLGGGNNDLRCVNAMGWQWGLANCLQCMLIVACCSHLL